MEVIEFKNNDFEYRDWMTANPKAFIIDTEKAENTKIFKLHKSNCHHISTPNGVAENAYTGNKKLKLGSYNVPKLNEWLITRKSNYRADLLITTCKTCKPLEQNSKILPSYKKISSHSNNTLLEHKIYQPHQLNLSVTDKVLDNRNQTFTEQDYLDKYKNQLAKGTRAEEIVLEDESKFLIANGFPDKAKEVDKVSSNPDYGFDIRSYELDGSEKQIEVKSLSSNSLKSFFITAHELEKSKELSNYYIYCVYEDEGNTPTIYRLKKPNLQDEMYFRITCINYKVHFS